MNHHKSNERNGQKGGIREPFEEKRRKEERKGERRRSEKRTEGKKRGEKRRGEERREDHLRRLQTAVQKAGRGASAVL